MCFKASASKNGFFIFFLKIYSSHFEKRTFLKCPILKSDPISFSDFLGGTTNYFV